jgi:antitoxin component YwqK of YwqJK toxin-antitoxin module
LKKKSFEKQKRIFHFLTLNQYTQKMSEEVKTHYWPNGNKNKEYRLLNGKRHGLETWWHENGQKDSECTWVNGQKHGLDTSWYETGQKRYERTWVNGQKHGRETWWYETGQKKYECTRVNGQEHGRETWWYENGQKASDLTRVNGQKHGLKIWWYENGQKYHECTWVNGQKHGYEIYYKDDGSVKSFSFYQFDELISDSWPSFKSWIQNNMILASPASKEEYAQKFWDPARLEKICLQYAPPKTDWIELLGPKGYFVEEEII